MKALTAAFALALITVAGVPQASRAQPATTASDEVTTAKQQLKRQLQLITDIEPFIKRMDLARLRVLKIGVERVLSSIETRGLAHMETIRSYQVLIVTFRYSEDFFNEIGSGVTQRNIAELSLLNAEVIKQRGFDDSPYTQVANGVFTQVRQLFLELEKLPVERELLDRVQQLTPDLGRVLSIASEGDHPKTFAAATALHRKILALYPDFAKIQASNAAFEVILSIQGLNEFYAKFARLED